MADSIHMRGVIEAPDTEELKHSCPWPVADAKPFSWIRLWGDMTELEVGLVVVQLAAYNQIAIANEPHWILSQILNAETLVLPGGIEVVSHQGENIPPSCCCGLEGWREWETFLETGDSPWLGHDPSPWLERRDNSVRIWSDGGLEQIPARKAFSYDVATTAFKQDLRFVEKDLRGFIYRFSRWSRSMGFAQANELVAQINRCFDIDRNL